MFVFDEVVCQRFANSGEPRPGKHEDGHRRVRADRAGRRPIVCTAKLVACASTLHGASERCWFHCRCATPRHHKKDQKRPLQGRVNNP